MTPYLFECHDEALHRWRAAGVRNLTLVHVDAHHDLSWLDDEWHLHIGNYVCQALKDGICRAVWWVVPDGTLRSPRARSEVVRQLRQLRREYPGRNGRVRGQAMSATLLGCEMRVCEWHDLPQLRGPLLLDIDTDYLVTGYETFHTGFPGASPWILPQALAARLAPLLPQAAKTTIAYSVEGGYTPLAWKFLADELAERLRPSAAPEKLASFARLHEAHRLIAEGQYEDADRACAAAGDCAAAAFAHSISLMRRGAFAEARAARLHASSFDPAYDTAYASGGLAALEAGKFEEARRAFEDALRLDPLEPHAHAGLARLAADRGQWSDAERAARSALNGGLDAPDLHRLLARALERQGRARDAIGALKQSLKAGLHGRATTLGALAALASTTPTRLPVQDGGHARAYATLARLEAGEGHVAGAVAALRLAISGGHRDPSAHARLARLYAVQRRWRSAIAEAGRAIVLLLESAARSMARAWHAVAARLEAVA